MTVTVPTRRTPVVEIEHPGDLEERRRQALAEAVSAARAHAEGRAVEPDPDYWVPALALRSHGRGCVTLALAGSYDAAGIEYLRTTTHELDLLATVELVVDCSALTRCDVSLAVPRELAREIGLGTR